MPRPQTELSSSATQRARCYVERGGRVFIADDQPIVRSGLTKLLNAQSDIEVVSAAADGREAVQPALQRRPDVGLFDIRMPLMDGIEATRRLPGPDVTNPLPNAIITTFDLDE